MKYQFAILSLWLIAVATTFVATRGSGAFSILAPVFGVCMIGSVVVVRTAVSRPEGPAGR